MSSLNFILQLLIISAFGLMVQSAPVNDVTERSAESKREMNQRKLENNLYCAAQSLHHTQEDLEKAKFVLPSFPQADINNNIKTIINKMFHRFSNLCKNFTKVMILKHQLQEYLFNNDTAPELNFDNAKKLSTILTSLQTMADIFDDMQFNKDNSRCVKLTPAQYRIMYYAQKTSPLLKSLKHHLERWYRDDSLYEYPEVRHC